MKILISKYLGYGVGLESTNSNTQTLDSIRPKSFHECIKKNILIQIKQILLNAIFALSYYQSHKKYVLQKNILSFLCGFNGAILERGLHSFNNLIN